MKTIRWGRRGPSLGSGQQQTLFCCADFRMAAVPALPGNCQEPSLLLVPKKIPGNHVTATSYVCVALQFTKCSCSHESRLSHKAETVNPVSQVRKLRPEEGSQPLMANGPGRCWMQAGFFLSRRLLPSWLCGRRKEAGHMRHSWKHWLHSWFSSCMPPGAGMWGWVGWVHSP